MERIKRALAEAVEKRKKQLANEQSGGINKSTPIGGMWLGIAAIVSLVILSAILWFDTSPHLNAAAELSSLEVIGQGIDGPREDLESLIHKIDALTASVTLLEGKLERLSMLINSTHATATGITPAGRVERKSAPGVVVTPPENSESKNSQWVVTLASLPSKLSADRFSRAAKLKGVSVEQYHVKVAGQDFWRIQVTDFQTADAARSYAGTVEQKLGLKDVWVSQR